MMESFSVSFDIAFHFQEHFCVSFCFVEKGNSREDKTSWKKLKNWRFFKEQFFKDRTNCSA